jgi:hypothetical protein
MSTIVNTVVTAIVSALESAPAVASQVDRVRLRRVSQQQDNAVAVRPVQTEVAQAAMSPGYPVLWTTMIAVECYVRSGAATAADVAVDALLEQVYARLMQDPTLGGAVLALQPKGISYDFDADGDHSTCATFIVHAQHRAAGGTLS